MFRRTLVRSLLPIVLAAAVVVGGICGLSLHYVESSAVARLKDDAAPGIIGEVERSEYRVYRDQMAREYEELMARQATRPSGAYTEN